MKFEKPILAVLCACVSCGILIAGLWPFFPPKNQVSWLDHENGLVFGEYGTIVSSGIFNPQSPGAECTVELWLQPGLSFDSNTMLDIYTPEHPFQFRMRQSGDDLAILREYQDEQNNDRRTRLYVDHVFRQGRSVLVTVTGGAQGTSIYLNGQLAKTSPQFGLTSRDLRGQIILGAAPVDDDRWSGKLLGLVIYAAQLNPQQVLHHYQEWGSGQVVPAPDERTRALYLFSERAGSVVHNQINNPLDLYIPKRFTVVGQVLLMPPWKEYSPGWSYYKYIIINIAGFVPLGFFFCAYFSRNGTNARATLNPILIGAATSLIIEVLQAYIPTRQSGITDLITNTLGSALGVRLFQSRAVQLLIGKLDELSSHKVREDLRLHAFGNSLHARLQPRSAHVSLEEVDNLSSCESKTGTNQ